jgi:hypothetical protein
MNMHEPDGWINRVPTMQDGGHQIRLYATQGNYRCAICCACGARIAVIKWGGDHWTPYRAHETEATA